MFYYKIALLGSPLEPLTYESKQTLLLGKKVVVPLSKRSCEGVIIAQSESPAFETQSITSETEFFFSSAQIETARFVSSYYICSLGDALNLFVPYRESKSEPLCNDGKCPPNVDIALSDLQNKALDFVRSHPISLIFGDTGSGKSEIYMKRIDEMIRHGKRALLLLPEISLTPQMQSRFQRHFGDSFVLWHSKMTPKQKRLSLEAIYVGRARIIAGPRSALFLPIEDLGLIVVDEEHDDSYKSSSRPRYHAKDMAVYIGTRQGIPVVLGSATPSLSSYAKFPSFRLKGGYFASNRRFVFEPSVENLSERIDQSVLENFSEGKQGIVFLPTRANFKYLICDSCGYTLECPFCSVGMSLHKHARALKCHYCNYTEPLPTVCPKCHSGALSTSRLGTAEAVEHFRTLQEGLEVVQFDRDSITTNAKLTKILGAFNEGKIDLLVGTQMLSKGHDYHDVTLAVIMGIDNLLASSDFRAKEKALALLIQIAGRSGRKHDSLVYVQSFNEPFFRRYVDDYETFIKDELLSREGRYPPYKKLARLLFSHANGLKAQAQMEEAVKTIEQFSEVEIVGWGASPIEKIAGKYRYQILLRGDKGTDLIRVIVQVKTPMCEIDMDPIEFS
ncbi:MAG: primosomal protein N' [Sulfuricurvum sp.]